MNKIHPVNDFFSNDIITISPVTGKDLSQKKQASPNQRRPNITVRSIQEARSKLRETPSGIVENIATEEDNPVNPKATENTDLDQNNDRKVEIPKTRSTVSEDANNPSHDQKNAENDENSIIALTLEKEHHQRIASLRTNTFRAILSNQFDLTLFQWMKYVFYVLATILIPFLMTFFITMIPIHNPILCQQHWYEILFSFTPWIILTSLVCAIGWSISLNIDYRTGIRRTLMLLFVGILASHVTIISVYFVWTDVGHFFFLSPILQKLLSLSY